MYSLAVFFRVLRLDSLKKTGTIYIILHFRSIIIWLGASRDLTMHLCFYLFMVFFGDKSAFATLCWWLRRRCNDHALFFSVCMCVCRFREKKMRTYLRQSTPLSQLFSFHLNMNFYVCAPMLWHSQNSFILHSACHLIWMCAVANGGCNLSAISLPKKHFDGPLFARLACFVCANFINEWWKCANDTNIFESTVDGRILIRWIFVEILAK